MRALWSGLARLFGARGAGNEASQAMAPPVPDWERSPVWQEYKRYYKGSHSAPSLVALRALTEDATRWWSALDTFLGDKRLGASLRELLIEQWEVRERQVQQGFGKPPPFAPDWDEELERDLPRLDAKYYALRTLRAAGGRDPWLGETLEPSLRRTFDWVGRVVRNGGNGELVAKARPLLREVKRWLAEQG